MAKEEHTDPIEKRSMSKYLFLLGSLFFVISVYAMIDDGFIRRTYKGIQNSFNKYEHGLVYKEYEALKTKIETEDKKREEEFKGKTVEELPSDPKKLSLKQSRLKLEQATIAQESADYKKLSNRLHELDIELHDAKQAYGFTKADQDEIYYHWKHHEHEGKDYKPYKEKYWDLETEIKRLKTEVSAAEARQKEAEAKVGKFDQEVAKWVKAEEDYFAPLKAMERRLKTIKGRGTEIKQVVIPDLGLVGVIEWGKVDRCMTCHMAVDRKGFEKAEEDLYKTHPHRDVLLKNHPVAEFGCTTCHWGQGRATQIKNEPMGHDDFVHGFEHHWLNPLLRGDFVQSSCHKCHGDQYLLKHAPVATKGKRLFMELGCIGCHSVDGYEKFPKAGPSLQRVGAKINPEWLIPWILNPQSYDPHTRMPQVKVTKEEATQIVSYIMQTSGPYKLPFGTYPGTGNADQGKKLFGTIGCYGCHSLDGKGATFAPTLDRIMDKTNANWVYNWIQDPKSYHATAKMPRLRLTKQEAADITAYLVTKGKKPAEDEALRAALSNPANKDRGYMLITQRGCYGCHDIEGTERLSKLSVDLTSVGLKTTDKLDFGDTDVPETWEDWIFNKIKNPQSYVHTRASSVMPQFALKDNDIHALVVFLKGLRGYTPPEKYVPSALSADQRAIDKGRRLTRRLNCVGCHQIEGEGGDIVSLYDDPSAAPPNLAGEGAKVQPNWLFHFLRDPGRTKIRPWLDVRMPNFDFSDEAAETLVKYFAALDNKGDVFVTLPREPASPEMLAAGKLLASKQYFSCFSCHVQGSQTPAGPKSMWGPDLNMIPKRIRPDFIAPWVQDAQKFTPGVNMPAFLPVPGSGPPNILGGDVKKQAQAIADYLLRLTSQPQAKAEPKVKKKRRKRRRKKKA